MYTIQVGGYGTGDDVLQDGDFLLTAGKNISMRSNEGIVIGELEFGSGMEGAPAVGPNNTKHIELNSRDSIHINCLGAGGGAGEHIILDGNGVTLKANERITTNVGLVDGTTSLPSSGYFYNTTRIGGYHPTTGIQQAGIYNVTVGSEAQIFSPIIIIGSTAGWGHNSSIINKTDAVHINAQTNINMSASTHNRWGNFLIYNGYLSVSGHAYATSFTPSSDDRLKHNEEDLTDCLSVIRKLKPQKYQKTKEMKEADFNGQLNEDEYTIEAGFIAQDIMNDIPELTYSVSGGDETKTVTDEEGIETQVIIEKPHFVNYNDILTHNVAATKELDTIVTNLLTKIATLEARITELENK